MKVDPKIQKIIAMVKGKRALAVIRHIEKHGIVTTDDLEKMGYIHPPRAVRDVRENGIPIKMVRIKGKDGKSIAAYSFGDPAEIQDFKLGGRQVFSKEFKKKLFDKQEGKCAICAEEYEAIYLQIDHRIPYEFMGDGKEEFVVDDFMLLCATCNRKKDKATETCAQTCFKTKDLKIIKSCYWASPENYTHICTEPIRRAEIVWKGSDVKVFDKIAKKAKEDKEDIATYIKYLLKD